MRTVVYDRAGLGKSDANPRPYRVQDEATALRRALDRCDIKGPIILVPHSYGGFISEITASEDKRVRGLVMVDANVPSFFDDKEAALISARYTPLAKDLIKERPNLGRNLLRQDQAYPATARYMRRVHVPLDLPAIDITAEHTWVDIPAELSAMRRAHAEFVAASSNRVAVFAKGSGHYVSRDQPEIVINAVLRLASQIQQQPSPPKRSAAIALAQSHSPVQTPRGMAEVKVAPDEPSFSKVDALIRDYVGKGVPSIAIAVTQHGRIIWEEAVGLADRDERIAATVDTPYYLASVSKTITATALMKLVQDGKVSLDAPVNDYLGEAKLTSQTWNPADATIKRMATHTAGLTSYDRSCLLNDAECKTDAADLIQRYGVIVWRPGDQFDYSNADYGILGEVIAHSYRGNFAGAIQKSVFEPLRMNHCFLDNDLKKMRSAALRYDSSQSERSSPPQRSSTPGASAIYCSVRDLAQFGMFSLKDHLETQKSILSDHSIDEMQKPLVDTDDGGSYGLGWWIQSDLNGYRGVLAQGGTRDATAYLQLIPSQDISVAMLWNTGTSDGSEVMEQVLAALRPPAQDTASHTSASEVPSQSSSTKPLQPVIGTWVGLVHTYKGDVPLTIVIDPSGGGSAQLGPEPVVHIPHFRFAGNAVKCSLSGFPGLGDTGPDPYDIDFKLYAVGEALVGAARTQTRPPSEDTSQLFYSVRLQRAASGDGRSSSSR
ncbi:alpha/beta fold hydrolase [Occallatibacter riparius]|uniref:Alpha/beta fold hydrolase n=1 Tax=Occallatibacter riparius TaxID=1002689 RepID=A0A9J7BVS9_9BACT|nr:alpha/beta fold hydrolase [Occallatibacter riparius]